MAPRVSVIIPFYNCAYVDQAIASALNQSYRDLEVIVVDDGSTVHVNKLAPFAGRIRYFRKSNGGTGSALNEGIRQAAGEYIAWLSSDDLFCPGKIERQLAFMQAAGSEISHTAYGAIDEHGSVTEASCVLPLDSWLTFCRLLASANPVNGCTIMARRGTFMQSGLFNEALRYTQDYEMWLRLVCRGIRFDYMPEPLTMYRFHSGMGTRRNHAAMLAECDAIQAAYREPMAQVIRALGG